MDNIIYQPIGIIHSPFNKPEGMPIQPASAKGIQGEIEIFPEFAAGLKDIEGFSHLIILFQFHLSEGYNLEVTPFLDNVKHGIFATRAPRRPNQIGLSVVKLNYRTDNILYIENVDIVNGTPLIDIKPYVPVFDEAHDIKSGWLGNSADKLSNTLNDGRFSNNNTL
ncbi:MAG: tRNA (N6-threonylcarbamoyladenosine(37)-N6)-methyltransferase TrmO [Bacteroidales bacterium]|nr:tRNA (N6-threonylcarbamoyladenosine(37)-N6)-methyltransferase TrmO [Bacteroidales bacterium]